MASDGSGGGQQHDFGSFRLDLKEGAVLREGRVQPLQRRAFDLLVYLVEARGRVVGKEELLAAIWRGETVSENMVAQSVKKIRRAIGDDLRHPVLIRTIHRVGYRFEAPSATGRHQSPRPADCTPFDLASAHNEVRALNLMAWRLTSTDAHRAVEIAERARALAEKLGQREAIAQARLARLMALLPAEHGPAVLNEIHELRDLLRDGGATGVVRALLAESSWHYAQLDPDRALALLNEAHPWLPELHDPFDLWMYHHNLSALYGTALDLGQSVRHGLLALRWARQIDGGAIKPHVAYSAASLGWAQLRACNGPGAQQFLREALHVMPKDPLRPLQRGTALGLANALLQGGDCAAALAAAQPYLKEPTADDAISGGLFSSLCAAAGEALFLLGRPDEARTVAETSLHYAKRYPATSELARCHLVLARLAPETSGAVDEHLDAALAALTAAGPVERSVAAAVYLTLSERCEAHGDWEGAQRYLKLHESEVTDATHTRVRAEVQLLSLQAELEEATRARDLALARTQHSTQARRPG